MCYIAHIYADSGNINAAWNGGPYIEIFMGDDDVPAEIINVWDYEKDKPFIRPTGRDFCQYLTRWLKRNLDIRDIRGYRFETVDDGAV